MQLQALKARGRGGVLMEYSNDYNALLLIIAANRSEISVGYCTLYGDTDRGLNVIGEG